VSDVRRPALALLLGCLLLVAGASALDGYDYYQTIEYAGCDQDIYQQDIVIHRSTGTAYNETAGGLETWHIYVGEHCREDYGDIRFTNSTGELAYYLWPDYTSSSARFAVRLEGATSAGTLAAHYGNAATTTTSNGTNTYLLFDHFDGAANAAPNPDLWEVVKKGSSSATVKLDGNGNLLLAGASNTISSGNAWGKPLLSRGVIIEYRGKISDKAYPDTSYGKGGVGGVFDADPNTWWHTGLFSAYVPWVQDGTVSTSCNLRRTNPSTEGNTETLATATSAFYPSINTFYTHRFEVQSADLKFYRSGVLIASGSDTTYSGNDFRLLFSQGEYSTGAGGTRTIDYVLIRTYSAAPPAATTFSGEMESDAPQPFPGLTLIPRDLAGNGLYTDINGNNRLDYNDLTIFFQNLAWAKTAQPIACFDFNGNGWLDYNDVVTLFMTTMEEHT
jgi:large repetitive protein